MYYTPCHVIVMRLVRRTAHLAMTRMMKVRTTPFSFQAHIISARGCPSKIALAIHVHHVHGALICMFCLFLTRRAITPPCSSNDAMRSFSEINVFERNRVNLFSMSLSALNVARPSWEVLPVY